MSETLTHEIQYMLKYYQAVRRRCRTDRIRNQCSVHIRRLTTILDHLVPQTGE